MAKRDPERWGENSNIRPETQHTSWGGRWKENKKRDIQPIRHISSFIKCSADTGHCLKITPQILKQAKARKALSIKEYTLNKLSGVPGSMLSGEIYKSLEVMPGLILKASYLGRGKWQFNIVG